MRHEGRSNLEKEPKGACSGLHTGARSSRDAESEPADAGTDAGRGGGAEWRNGDRGGEGKGGVEGRGGARRGEGGREGEQIGEAETGEERGGSIHPKLLA